MRVNARCAVSEDMGRYFGSWNETDRGRFQDAPIARRREASGNETDKRLRANGRGISSDAISSPVWPFMAVAPIYHDARHVGGFKE